MNRERQQDSTTELDRQSIARSDQFLKGDNKEGT